MHEFVSISLIIIFILFLIYAWNKKKSFVRSGIIIGGLIGGFVGASMGLVLFGGGINPFFVFGCAGAVIGALTVMAFSSKEEETYKEEKKPTVKKTSNSDFFSIFFLFLFVGLFIIVLSSIENFDTNNKNTDYKKNNWRLDGVFEDETKTCVRQIVQKYPNINIVEFNSYKSFEVNKNTNQIIKKVTYDVKKKVVILGEMSFGTFDCFFLINNDASFSFFKLSDKY